MISPALIFARPGTDDIWLGTAQRAALEQLSGAEATKALIGPPSSGRSSILQYLPTQLGRHVVLGVSGPKSDARSILANALQSAGLAPWTLAEAEQRNLLAVFIRQRVGQGHRVIVTIDNAEQVGDEAWEEIELWRTWEDRDRPLIELAVCVTAGSRYANDPLLSSLAPSAMVVLQAPGEAEIAEYIDWRLSRFELQSVFTDTAIQSIASRCAGQFGAVNVLAQMSLLTMRQRGAKRIDDTLVEQASLALAERRRSASADERSSPSPASSTPSDPPAAQLIISREGKVVARVTLGERLLIGRSEHNDLCLPSPYLSRHHAAIVGTTEGYYVVDLNSANGLIVNNESTSRALLYDQDVLSIGPYRLKLQIAEGMKPSYPLPAPASLADTTVMPAQNATTTAVRIVGG